MARAAALLLLLGGSTALTTGCASTETPEPSDFGAPEGPLTAKLESISPAFEVGTNMKFRITLRNNGATRSTVILPDMNNPWAWTVRFFLQDVRTEKNTELGYGNLAAVGGPRNEKPFRIAIEPFDEKMFEIFLKGNWDGWSYFGTEKATHRVFAMAAQYPKPGRYRVRATYAPFHAEQPHLLEVPGRGVTTNDVELKIVPKP